MNHLKKLLQMVPAVVALTLSAPALAGVPVPDVPQAVKGEQCVEPIDDMRRNHMKYLQHHRDDTMHRGIRTKQHSLKECLECHVPAQQPNKGSQGSEQHFCQSCHTYAGVRIDCFECHATLPEKSALFHPLVTPAMKAAKQVHTPDSATLLNRLAGNLPNGTEN